MSRDLCARPRVLHRSSAGRTAAGRIYLLFLITAALLATAAVASAESPTATAPRGTTARWGGGDGTETCAMSGRTWPALEGVCYYPVDLGREPGRYEIARWRNGGPIETGWLTVTDGAYETQAIELPDDTYVHLSPEDQARHWAEQAETKPLLRGSHGPARFTLPLGAPAEPLPAGQYFGLPRTFNGVPKQAHTGLDYAIGMGNPVLAVADGTVLLAADHFFAGKSVYLAHGDGLISMYFHLSELDVEAGQEVTRGQTIAKVGSTGRSTGPHLHLGLRWHHARIDPAQLLGDPAAIPAVE